MVKGIDAVTRDQLVQIMVNLGVENVVPVFSMFPTFGPIKARKFLPTVTEEDRVVLDNVEKVVEFLTAGSSISKTSNQVPVSAPIFVSNDIAKSSSIAKTISGPVFTITF